MKKTNQKGIIQLVVLIIAAIIALSYFGIDLEEVFSKPLIKKNLIFTWDKTKIVWNDYIYRPLSDIFNNDEKESSDASLDE